MGVWVRAIRLKHKVVSEGATSAQVRPSSGAQFWPMRQPPAPLKSTQRTGRQSPSVTHGLRLSVHAPWLHVPCAQSVSCWQEQ